MIRNSLLLFIASAALAQPSIGTTPYDDIPSQGKLVMAGSANLGKAAYIRYKTTSTGASHIAGGFSGGVSTGTGLVHRFLERWSDGSYFGYDLVLGPGDAASGYQLLFQPLTVAENVLQSMGNGKTLVPMPLPQYPPPQIVHDGDIVVLDLMVSADGTQKLTDYIQFSVKAPEPQAASSTAAARDFTLDDGPVFFEVEQARFQARIAVKSIHQVGIADTRPLISARSTCALSRSPCLAPLALISVIIASMRPTAASIRSTFSSSLPTRCSSMGSSGPPSSDPLPPSITD